MGEEHRRAKISLKVLANGGLLTNEAIEFFLRLHQQDFQIIRDCCGRLSESQVWEEVPEGVPVANIICHVCEMEGFWIDHGLCDHVFERDRQVEFERRGDLSKKQLIERLDNREKKTINAIAVLPEQDWLQERVFHGDKFTGLGILVWHTRHVGLHRGHIQAHTRWLCR